MNYNELKQNLTFVIYGDDRWRISIADSKGRPSICYDAHGQTVKAAKRNIHNIIAMARGGLELCVIHGYNGGTAIRNMLQNEMLSSRVTSKICPSHNPGRTWIEVTGAY